MKRILIALGLLSLVIFMALRFKKNSIKKKSVNKTLDSKTAELNSENKTAELKPENEECLRPLMALSAFTEKNNKGSFHTLSEEIVLPDSSKVEFHGDVCLRPSYEFRLSPSEKSTFKNMDLRQAFMEFSAMPIFTKNASNILARIKREIDKGKDLIESDVILVSNWGAYDCVLTKNKETFIFAMREVRGIPIRKKVEAPTH